MSEEHQKTPLSLKKAGGGVQWGCCSEHPNQTSLILILILNLAFVPYHIPLFPAAGAPNLIGPIKTHESVLTCNSHPSSSFLSPKKTKIGSGISRPCQETYQLLCHDVVVTEGLEQGHEANLTASWGGRQKGALLFRIFASCHCRGTQIPAARLQICLPKPGSEAGPGSPSVCSGPGSQFSPLCGFPRFRENFSQVKKKWKEQEREEKNKKYGSFFYFMPFCPGISLHCLLLLQQGGQRPTMTRTTEIAGVPKIPVLALAERVTLSGITPRTSNADKATSLKRDFGESQHVTSRPCGLGTNPVPAPPYQGAWIRF